MSGTERKVERGDGDEAPATLQRELERHREELATQNEDLRRANARYALLYERAPVAYVTLDGARRIVELNAAASALLRGSSPDPEGAPRAPIRGRPLDELVAPSSRASFRAFHERLASEGVRQVHETVLETDGRRFLARLEAVRVDAEEGGASACLLCIGDETERRRLAEERRQLEAKVAEAFRVETLGLLAGGVAHDFRNVLGLALEQLSFASVHAKSNDRLHESLNAVRDALERAAHLSRQLLAYAGATTLNVEPLDVSTVIASAQALLSTGAPPDSLSFDLARDLPSVLAELVPLQQIVLNLVVNAGDAIGPGGTIVVRTRSEPFPPAALALGRAVLIEVEDDGRGMDEATRGRVFDPFFSTKGPGRGVGLSVVHGNVRAHGGTVTVESNPNQGSIFRVYLPVAGLMPETGAESEDETAPGWRGSGLVLVVDDNAVLRKVMGEHVVRLGFDTCFAGDGIEAIAAAQERLGELVAVLIDVAMPRMGGEKAIVELKRIDPKVPVILMSGLSRAQISVAATALADGFLEKPFTQADLGRVMQAALERYA